MLPWLRERYEIFRLTLRHSALLRVFALLQVAGLLLKLLPAAHGGVPLLTALAVMPWWAWAIGWLAVLWLTALEYSADRKKRFDETSHNFFKAYLDFLIHEGHRLYNHSDGKDFHDQIKDWQHQAVLGIAIGRGSGESERFFHNVEAKNPLREAYRRSREAGTNEPLCRALKDNLEELEGVRKSLPETGGGKKGGLVALQTAEAADPGYEATFQAPPTKQLPPSSKTN